MKESVLHYIWQNKLFVSAGQQTIDGNAVEIIDVGKLNSDGGPDFFNVKIRIGDTLWAGNAEIHILSSDWYKHGHQNDSAYDNVVLHVVQKADIPVTNSLGLSIPQLELQYDKQLETNYFQLIESTQWIPCAERIGSIHEIYINSFKTALLTERLQFKVESIRVNLNRNNNLWEETFMQLLGRNFGFAVNNDAFHVLMKSIPWPVIQKCRQSHFMTEALLFGQAGFLEDANNENDTYYNELKTEYEFLKRKFRLRSISASQWKMLRMRPDNFPQIRISQLASLIFQNENLFSSIISCVEIKQIYQKFHQIECSEYWKYHYVFSKSASYRKGKPGKSSIDIFIINAVIPALFAFGDIRNNQIFKDKALQLLENLPAEKNIIISNWSDLGMKINNASDSQAYIHLYKNYCQDKKCLRCRIGHQVLSKRINL